jgi:hypothetical protein
MNGPLGRILRCVGFGLLLAGTLNLALAHKASDAYLHWRVDGDRVHERIDIALRDLDRELALDADDDGRLRWGEVRRRWPEIVALADAAIVLKADGRGCEPLAAEPPRLDSHTDGRYAVLQRTLRCQAPVRALDVDYGLFAASDPTHRGILRLEHGPAEAQTAVLAPGGPRWRAQVGEPPPTTTATVRHFLGEGLHHIVIGLDHVLFLVTLLVVAVWRREGQGWSPASHWRPVLGEALRLVTAFTLGHSLTLGLAAAGVLAPPSRWVESLIALSVLVAAIDNLRPFVPGPRWLMVSVFGLVHGFGFAGPLQDLGLRGPALAAPLLGFNLGVEIGQLLVVAIVLPLAMAVRRTLAYERFVVRGGSVAVALLALAWTLERGLDLPLRP